MVAHDAPKDSRSDSVPFAGKIANGLRATLTERLGRTPAPVTILRVGDDTEEGSGGNSQKTVLNDNVLYLHRHTNAW
jgi:hypothetical protein